ncbi:MAG: 3-methyl-2-oxobutanoate dehydrogenase subunit VorB [bacterium]
MIIESKNINKTLMTGNEAIAEGAILAGCRHYFGYPITPQNEIPAYMAKRMPQVGGCFLQAESELAAINMVFGASAVGVRSMTSSSSPGISLMQEGISYLAGAELPAVVVNICRGGPGLGNIAGSQGDYFQATRGGGHGDYRTIVLGPASVQEMYDLAFLAFDLADLYRIPVLVLADGVLGQMMEPIVLDERWKAKMSLPNSADVSNSPDVPNLPDVPNSADTLNSQNIPNTPDITDIPEKPWALTGARNRPPRVVKSLYMAEGELEARNWHLARKYQKIQCDEVRYEEYLVEDARLLLVAYGLSARICRAAVNMARKRGIALGLFRPITLYPFPSAALAGTAGRIGKVLVVEMNTGQMIEDVRLAVNGCCQTFFYGRPGGGIFSDKEILYQCLCMI